MKVKLSIDKIQKDYTVDIKHPDIIEVKNFLTIEECKQILNKAESLSEADWSSIYMESIKAMVKAQYNTDDYQALIDNGTIGINNGIKDKVGAIDNFQNSQKWFDTLLTFFDRPDLIIPAAGSYSHIQRHYPGSKFDYHVDSQGFDGKADSNVMYTCVLYFNDDYNGGELDFPDQDITFKPGAGSLVIFNSGPEFTHGVKEIQEGPTRYAATCFIREKGDNNES